MSGEVVLHVGKVSGISGSENHLLLLLPALRERGWDVRFALLHEDEPGAWELARRLDETGVPVEGIRLPRALDPTAFSRLVRTIRRHRPAIVHTHLVHADFHGLPAARLAGVPVVASTKHGFNPFREGRVFALADRAVSSLADLEIAISAGLADYLCAQEGFPPGTFRVVHYGIEPGPEPPPPPAEPRLAFVGRLIPIKGIEDLLDAVARLDAPVAVTLELAGDGELRADLERRAAGLGLDGTTFLGRVAPATAVLERASVVVVPSHGEGFGMVALEAMERGRAVIATTVGGLPEIVEDGVTGLLVPPRDPDALSAAIASLIGDPARVSAMGAAGRSRALTAFSQEACTSRTEELYGEALAAASSRPRRSRRRIQPRSSANAASSASRKSHGTR